MSHAQKAFYDGQTAIRAVEQKVETLQVITQRCSSLDAQITAKDAALDDLKVRLAEENRQKVEAAIQAQTLQVQLAEFRAKLEAQQVIEADLRAMLVQQTAQAELQQSQDIE